MAAPREQPDSCAAPDADKCPYQGGDRGAPHPLHGAAQQVRPASCAHAHRGRGINWPVGRSTPATSCPRCRKARRLASSPRCPHAAFALTFPRATSRRRTKPQVARCARAVARLASTPLCAGSDNWVYPSQQQFFNAMLRKGWSPREEDMPQVVAIHNTVNERTWAEVRKWEAILQPRQVRDTRAIAPRLHAYARACDIA